MGILHAEFAVPGTVIGMSYILAFNKPPLLLTGTLAILVLNFVFRYMPLEYDPELRLLNRSRPAIERARLEQITGEFSRK